MELVMRDITAEVKRKGVNTLKVEVEDIAGNVGTKEESIVTNKLPDATAVGAINFSSPTWTLGKAEVTISTTTSFEIEYQINGTSGYEEAAGSSSGSGYHIAGTKDCDKRG